MKRMKSLDQNAAVENVSRLRLTASIFGVYAGLLGIEHGFFETLQGNVAPKSIRIMASPLELPFPFGHEPAMTLIPNFLVTGIAAIVSGLAIIAWSTAFLQRRHGAVVLLLLSVILLLVGGGFGPISLLIVACTAASRIGKPLAWWRICLPAGLRDVLAKLWGWFLVIALFYVPAEFFIGQLLDIKNDHRQTLTNVNLMLTYPMLVFFALTVIAGFASEIKRRLESPKDRL